MKTFKQFVLEGKSPKDTHKAEARAHKALQLSVKDHLETETKPKNHHALAKDAKEISHDILDHGFGPAKHIDRLAPDYFKKHFGNG